MKPQEPAGARILVAEDNLTSRVMLEETLKGWGYSVVSVDNGDDALQVLLLDEPPAIAILDWMMPGIEGIEVCRRVRNHHDRSMLYLILLSARTAKSDVVEGLDAGADDYISKPFDDNELRARINVARRMVEIQAKLEVKIAELSSALEHVKTLQGILPICCYCKKIRRDDRAWQQLEVYITQHSEAMFSHSICPECARVYFPDIET